MHMHYLLVITIPLHKECLEDPGGETNFRDLGALQDQMQNSQVSDSYAGHEQEASNLKSAGVHGYGIPPPNSG